MDEATVYPRRPVPAHPLREACLTAAAWFTEELVADEAELLQQAWVLDVWRREVYPAADGRAGAAAPPVA